MGGLAYNLTEVEKGGKCGAFYIDGYELLKAEFDALYPADTKSDVWLQLKKGNAFGWLNKKGVYSFVLVLLRIKTGLVHPQVLTWTKVGLLAPIMIYFIPYLTIFRGFGK